MAFWKGQNMTFHGINVDNETNAFAIEQLKATDLYLFGRKMYQLMESYWPKAAKDVTIQL